MMAGGATATDLDNFPHFNVSSAGLLGKNLSLRSTSS